MAHPFERWSCGHLLLPVGKHRHTTRATVFPQTKKDHPGVSRCRFPLAKNILYDLRAVGRETMEFLEIYKFINIII
jgi:hypothetical protein